MSAASFIFKTAFSILMANLEKCDQPNFQMIKPERDHCASLKIDCSSAKCYKTTGYRCIKRSATLAKCAKTCPKTGPCTVLGEKMTTL